MEPFRRIALTVKSDLDAKDEILERVSKVLLQEDVEVFVDPKRAPTLCQKKTCTPLTDKTKVDLLLVIGGDGTILRAIREMPDLSVPILSVNRGAVGFLAESHAEETEALLPKLLRGQGVLDERQLLSVDVERGGTPLFHGCVLNEAVIAQGAIARLLDLYVAVENEPLTTFHADGLIIATPTGSTAYSLSAGGPIVHPNLSATILTPLNPHSFSQKPLVIPGEQTVHVEVMKKDNKFIDTDVSLTLDGQTYQRLERGDRIRLRKNPHTVRFLRRAQDTFYATLRTKLKWGERLE